MQTALICKPFQWYNSTQQISPNKLRWNVRKHTIFHSQCLSYLISLKRCKKKICLWIASFELRLSKSMSTKRFLYDNFRRFERVQAQISVYPASFNDSCSGSHKSRRGAFLLCNGIAYSKSINLGDLLIAFNVKIELFCSRFLVAFRFFVSLFKFIFLFCYLRRLPPTQSIEAPDHCVDWSWTVEGVACVARVSPWILCEQTMGGRETKSTEHARFCRPIVQYHSFWSNNKFHTKLTRNSFVANCANKNAVNVIIWKDVINEIFIRIMNAISCAKMMMLWLFSFSTFLFFYVFSYIFATHSAEDRTKESEWVDKWIQRIFWNTNSEKKHQRILFVFYTDFYFVFSLPNK